MRKKIVFEGKVVKWFDQFPGMLEENGSLTISISRPEVESKFYEKVTITIEREE